MKAGGRAAMAGGVLILSTVAACGEEATFTNGGCVNFQDDSQAEPVSCDSDDADARLSSANDDCEDGRQLSFRGPDGDERFFCVTDL